MPENKADYILLEKDCVFFLKQWDEKGLKNVMTFTVQSLEGKSIWGSGYAALELLKV